MSRLKEIIVKYLTARDRIEMQKRENQLIIFGIIPILLTVAIANYVLYLFFPTIDTGTFPISTIIFVGFAAALYMTSRIKHSKALKSGFVITLVALMLIFVVLRYYTSVGPVVWTISYIFVLFTLINNDRIMMLVIALTMVALNAVVWIRGDTIEGGTLYYITQYITIVILFIVAAGIQTINVGRFDRISGFLRRSEMISRYTTDFINVNESNLREQVNRLLAETSAFFGADRAVITLVSKDRQWISYAYEWCENDQVAALGLVNDFLIKDKPEWVEQIENKKSFIIPDVDMSKPSDEASRSGQKALQMIGVKALISMPIIVKDMVYGVLIYQSHTRSLKWRQEHQQMLVVLTNLLSDAFVKIEAENEIRYMAFNDVLTDLPNRVSFEKKLQSTIEMTGRKNKPIGVVFIDLDEFKVINDTVGHEGGDAIIKQIGQRLSRRMQGNGFVARFGGDEFIITVTACASLAGLEKIIGRLMTVFTEPMYYDSNEFLVTASAGVSVYPHDGDNPATLIKNADISMTAAKELGKNQVYFCSSWLKEEIDRKIQLTNLLRLAMKRNEFKVLYQPLVDMATQEIIGVEALLRWYQPEFNQISPDQFIPLAEQSGLINQIGQWVLETACHQNKAWQDAGYAPIRMAVNLSVKQFHSPALIQKIRAVLSDSGLDPAYLELEITESVSIREAQSVINQMQEIKSLGVMLAIDDFGTEYSSLARIKQLPIDRIKIAMQFVHGISISEKDEAIVKTIISLANNLGLKVIAEGVETKQQSGFLQKSVCDEGQGFFYHRPMTAEEVGKLLREKVRHWQCSDTAHPT